MISRIGRLIGFKQASGGAPATGPTVPATALNWGGSSAELKWGAANYLKWG